MTFINIHIKNNCNKNAILDWMINQLYLRGDISLIELLHQHMDDLVIQDMDVLSYHEVGWNVLDLYKLDAAKYDPNNLEIPQPKCCFEKHYT